MLKYYIYISATKVNMLYPQIPPEFLATAEAELKVNLGILSTGIKSRNPDPPSELAGRVGVVAKYIREHDKVGTPESPNTWFHASARFRWGVLRDYAADIALFGGRIGERLVVLLGSSDSLVGAAQSVEAQHALNYYTLRFFNEVVRARTELVGRQPPAGSWKDVVEFGLTALPDTEHQVEFLARVLHEEGNLLVATPLYVSLA